MRILVATAFALLIQIVCANAQWGSVVISNDMGGIVSDYAQKYDQLLFAGTPVVLAGDCVSACTMVLRLPRNQVCAMPGARLGFHAARLMFDSTPSKKGTEHMAAYWTPAARKWFYSRPLSLNLRYRRATDFFPRCGR